MNSLLSVIDVLDNFPPHPAKPYPTHSPDGTERYVPWHLTLADFEADLTPIGLLRPAVIMALQAERGGEEGSPWVFHQAATSTKEGSDEVQEAACVYFADWLLARGVGEMGRVVQDLTEKWRSEGVFPDLSKGWRNELLQVYASPRSSLFESDRPAPDKPFGNKIFAIERIAVGLFGVVVQGVHLTAYEGEGEDIKIWVGKRSMKKKFPGMLDNTVCGALTAGMSPLECMLKESEEEASFPAAFLEPRIKAAGSFSYFKILAEGSLQPAIGYEFDVRLPPSTSAEYLAPTPSDDEVTSFALMSVSDTLAAMRAGKFKPDCAAVLVDFMIRHGLINSDNEPNYLEIRWRLARRLGIAVPSS